MSETTTPAAEAPAKHNDQDPLTERLTAVAGRVRERAHRGGDGMSRGDRAELRRMRKHPDRVPPAVFWGLFVDSSKDKDNPVSWLPEADESFWLTVVPLMVDYPHEPGRLAGQALAEASVSDQRVQKWLRLSMTEARREAWRLLAKLDRGFDWGNFGKLLYEWDEPLGLSLRRSFYRNYYRSANSGSSRDQAQQTKRNGGAG